jgi:hypothetical protein
VTVSFDSLVVLSERSNAAADTSESP